MSLIKVNMLIGNTKNKFSSLNNRSVHVILLYITMYPTNKKTMTFKTITFLVKSTLSVRQ